MYLLCARCTLLLMFFRCLRGLGSSGGLKPTQEVNDLWQNIRVASDAHSAYLKSSCYRFEHLTVVLLGSTLRLRDTRGMQATLFKHETLLGGVTYIPDFIAPKEADEFLATFLRLDWHQHIYRATGKAPRLYAWMGVPYTSQNLASKNVVTEWTAEAKEIKKRVEQVADCTFDSLNMNRYRDNRDSIAWHSDGEAEGRWESPIASVSLGAGRKFQWRRKKDSATYSQSVEHGSLLIMPAGFQRDYLHQIPKQQKPCGERINLTFRRKAAK